MLLLFFDLCLSASLPEFNPVALPTNLLSSPLTHRRCCQTGRGWRPGATCQSPRSTLTVAATSPVWPATRQYRWANEPLSPSTSTVCCFFFLCQSVKVCRWSSGEAKLFSCWHITAKSLYNFNQLPLHLSTWAAFVFHQSKPWTGSKFVINLAQILRPIIFS